MHALHNETSALLSVLCKGMYHIIFTATVHLDCQLAAELLPPSYAVRTLW